MAISNYTLPQIIESTFRFPEFVSACKNQFLSSVHFWDTVNFRFPWWDWPAIFDHVCQKKFDQLFNLWICINMCKINLFQLFILQIQPISEFLHQTGHTHFWPCPSKKIFNHLLICVNLYQLGKTQLILAVHS